MELLGRRDVERGAGRVEISSTAYALQTYGRAIACCTASLSYVNQTQTTILRCRRAAFPHWQLRHNTDNSGWVKGAQSKDY